MMRIKKIVFGENGFIEGTADQPLTLITDIQVPGYIGTMKNGHIVFINTSIIEFLELESPVIPGKCCQNGDLW